MVEGFYYSIIIEENCIENTALFQVVGHRVKVGAGVFSAIAWTIISELAWNTLYSLEEN